MGQDLPLPDLPADLPAADIDQQLRRILAAAQQTAHAAGACFADKRALIAWIEEARRDAETAARR